MSRNLHPTFQSKTVVKLLCKCCERCLCARGMKAILLADTKVELYSTDLPPERVPFVDFVLPELLQADNHLHLGLFNSLETTTGQKVAVAGLKMLLVLGGKFDSLNLQN